MSQIKVLHDEGILVGNYEAILDFLVKKWSNPQGRGGIPREVIHKLINRTYVLNGSQSFRGEMAGIFTNIGDVPFIFQRGSVLGVGGYGEDEARFASCSVDCKAELKNCLLINPWYDQYVSSEFKASNTA